MRVGECGAQAGVLRSWGVLARPQAAGRGRGRGNLFAFCILVASACSDGASLSSARHLHAQPIAQARLPVYCFTAVSLSPASLAFPPPAATENAHSICSSNKLIDSSKQATSEHSYTSSFVTWASQHEVRGSAGSDEHAPIDRSAAVRSL